MLLGINNQDWGRVGLEALSFVAPPVDIVRGVYELTQEDSDKSLAYSRILFGVVGSIPTIGFYGRLFTKSAHTTWALRAAAQMTKWEKVNKALGTFQAYVGFPLAITGMVTGGYRFVTGVSNWGDLDSQDRADSLIGGMLALAPIAMTFGHANRARKVSEATFKKHPDLDYFAMKREQLGPLPSTKTAPKYRWQGKVDVNKSAGTMTITYDTTDPSKILTGASGKEKLEGFFDLLRYGFGSWGASLPAIYRGDRLLLQRMANQWADTALAKTGNARGIKIHGIDHIPDEEAVFLSLNHVNMTDFVAMRRVVDSVPTASSSGFDQAITIKPALRWVPVLGQVVGLSSRLAGKRLQPVVSGNGGKALGDNMAYLGQTRSPKDMERALRHRAIFVYGPGTRTVGKNPSGNPPDDPRIIWRQAWGAFNTAAHANVPLVPISFYYQNDWVHVQFHQPVRPDSFQESAEDTKAVAMAMWKAVTTMIQKDLVGAGYFTRYMPVTYQKHHKTSHTGMLGGA